MSHPKTVTAVLHAQHEKRIRHSREDPERAWQCCDLWPRKILGKWNGREFSASYGATLPELFACGRSTRKLSLNSLPPRFVVRPEWGSAGHGVLVIVEGRELRRDEEVPGDVTFGSYARSRGTAGRYLVEEFIARDNDAPQLPVEYKCHVFGDMIAGIEVIDRDSPGPHRVTKGYFRPDWTQFDEPMDTSRPPVDVNLPDPPFRNAMIDLSGRLGATIGTYMRIDFFAGKSSFVFNEFSSAPNIKRPMYTPYCNDLFGRFWDEKIPDAI
jgi:hypothetical protein